MNQISQDRCGCETHGEKRRTHVALEQRAMLSVIGWRIVFEGGDCPFQKPGQNRAKVFGNADSTDTMQIVQRPNDTGRARVETGVTISHAIVAWMTRPERVGIELGDRIGCNFFDHRPDSQFIPGVVCKRAMTTEGNHA
jgi:hypothetical protein